MKTSILGIAPVVLSFHLVHSYILLTANLEDVHAIAKQIASSPVVGQLNTILRRAANMFNKQVERSTIQKRVDEDLDSDGQVYPRDQRSDISVEEQDSRIERRQADSELVALGKNVSGYLKSIKNMFENVKT